jgi:hypothetical protein
MAAIWNCPPTSAGNIRHLKYRIGSELRMLRMTFQQNSIIRGCKKCGVLNDMNAAEYDFLWEEDHEENSSSSDESVGSD